MLLCLCAGILLTEKSFATRPAFGSSGKGSGHKEKLSTGLTASGTQRGTVVLQLNGKPSGKLNALLNRSGVHVRSQLKALNAFTVEMPASVLEELASFSEVEFVSADSAVASFGHVSAKTGMEAVRPETETIAGITT